MMDGETESVDLPVYDDGPHDDVEIEITEEDLGENLADFGDPEDGPEGEEEQVEGEHAEEGQSEDGAEEAEAGEGDEAVEKPKRRDAQRRIAELSRRAADAERRAEEVEARLRQEAALRQQSDVAMMTHYENALNARMQELKAKWIDADNLGDQSAKFDLNAEISSLQTDLNGVKQWKQQQAAALERQRQAPPPQQAAPQPAQQQTPTLEKTTAEWIQRNDWFQPNTPNFDPEMHEEATLYARRIERRYRSEGRDADIGSVAYFTEIDRHLRSEFPDAFETVAPPKKASPPMSRNTPVTPVTRSAPEGQQKNSKTVRLSSDQRRIAHQLAESGAIKKQNGARMTPAEAERYYAVHVMKQNRR